MQNKVRVIGYLKPDEKTVILSRAKYFAYLSLYEGFGLPILEALAAGTPVITSKNSVMEEVAEKYACYANPINSKDILVKMQEMLQNYGYYKKLAESAIIELIPKFNWKFSGEKYYQIYKSLL